MSYPNFYTNVCMFLGSLKRGVCHKHPFVTFPVSKVGLDLARILHNLGVIASYECFQNTKRIHKNHYKRWAPAAADAPPTSTTEFARAPHVYLKLHLSYDKFHPKFLPEGASPLDFNRSFFAPTPEDVKVLSSTRQQRFASCRAIIDGRQNYGPGIFLVSTDIGLLTDIEAEHYNKGGVVLGFIGLPLSSVLQIRGMLLGKLAEEAGTRPSQRAPLQSWSLSAAVREELTQRSQAPHIMLGQQGEPGSSLYSADEQMAALDKDIERIRESDEAVRSQLEEHQELLQRQVVAWNRRSMLEQLVEQQQDNFGYRHGYRGGHRDGNQGGGFRRRLQDY